MSRAFVHRQAAHCENGATASLLAHAGLDLTEPLVFGIGGGLVFAYLPFIRVNGLPLASFRTVPGSIFRQACRRLGVRVETRRFRVPAAATAALDQALDQGTPVGLQTGMYWLPYVPPALRFHFNAHNVVVFDREGDRYRVSDPVFPSPVTCGRADLERARFAPGPLAPRGRMYRLFDVPARPDLRAAARAGLAQVARAMVKVPLPLVGVRGIRWLAGRLEGWPQRLGERKAALHLGHLIRMQEEIGTGGGGFRFLFAAFLQECVRDLGLGELDGLAERMTAVGDRWREFALRGARHCKGRDPAAETFPALAELLRAAADEEEVLFRDLLGRLGR